MDERVAQEREKDGFNQSIKHMELGTWGVVDFKLSQLIPIIITHHSCLHGLVVSLYALSPFWFVPRVTKFVSPFLKC